MRRIKVVSEATDLVPVLRAFDSDVKRDVFRELIDGWVTMSSVQEKYGAEGVAALQFFEKTKLVETKWEAQNGKTEKAYHSYYTAFHINTQCSVQEISEILAVAAMADPQFRQTEDEIAAIVGHEDYSARAITEKLGISVTRLKALLKRSSRLDLRGHLVKRME
jgi:predicted DNA-binding ArsR family transcriptional regulator